MAAIAAVNARAQTGAFLLPQTTLSADDTITYDSNKKQFLSITNTTGGSLTVTIDGSSATTVTVPGVGPVDVSGGYAITVAPNTGKGVVLGAIREYLPGVVHLLGGAGLKITLIEF